MSKLLLPCLRGTIGNWTFYCSVMKIEDVVGRVKTVAESEELYSDNINEILQRELNKKRVEQIREYLNTNREHFFSSIIVAIYNGDPKWYDFEVESRFRVDNNQLDFDSIDFIENKLGILSLSGDEIIFALDGQHRIMGIREAYSANKSIGKEEVSLMFVVHNQENIKRTRRLFTVLNKYAQKPKEAELIILDEDDAAAIITRRLLDNHTQLKKKASVSNTNSSNIASSDLRSFTTLVTINRINKIILKSKKIDYTKRPKEALLEEYYAMCFDYWDYFFSQFPAIVSFIDGNKVYFDNGDLFNRNKETGGSLLLRPIGQLLFSELYTTYYDKGNIEELTSKIPHLDFNLNGGLCKYIIWNGKIIPKSESLIKRVFYYVLGLNTDRSIQADIRKSYETYGEEYNNTITKLA